MSRVEFSIILANLAKAGNLLPMIQSFAALYVLLLAIAGPLLTKQSESIYTGWLRLMDAIRTDDQGGPEPERSD